MTDSDSLNGAVLRKAIGNDGIYVYLNAWDAMLKLRKEFKRASFFVSGKLWIRKKGKEAIMK